MAAVSNRERYVVDPVWRVLNLQTFLTEWNRLLQEARECGYVGLDLEWTTVLVEHDERSPSAASPARSHPKRLTGPVATVQLSTNSASFIIKYCDLWHLVKGDGDVESGWEGDPYRPASNSWPHHRMGEKRNALADLHRVLDNVHQLLKDDAVAKVGVGIAGDMTKLQRDYPGVLISPCVDLVTLANYYICTPVRMHVQPCGITSSSGVGTTRDAIDVHVSEIRSLKEMCAVFCGRPLEKDASVVMSNWGGSLGALSPKQIHYAAVDAEVSLEACASILSRALTPEKTGCIVADSDATTTSKLGLLRPLFISAESGTTAPGVVRGGKRDKGVKKTLTQRLQEYQEAGDTQAAVPDVEWCKGRAKRYYDNINVFDPQMRLVFTVDQSKAEWYVYKKGIAEVVEWRCDTNAVADDTSSQEKRIAGIKLSFTPDFRKFNDAHIRRNLEYFQQPKENVCVVCGSDHALVRFAVIPMMYRKYFPSVYMSHNSYDLLLLCISCFAKSRAIYEAERQAVSNDFGIPLSHLIPSRLQQFEKQIAATEECMPELSSEMGTGVESDLVAHHLPARLRLKVMKEYAAMERHHDCMVTILKFAKALHVHYVSTGVDAGSSLVGERRFCIPEAKVTHMRSVVDTTAPQYYFYERGGPSEAVVSDPSFPSSPDGVRWILAGSSIVDSGDGTCDADTSDDRSPGSFRLKELLTAFWLREHPEISAYIPRTVRAEEKSETPLVDSHGFFVVRMLMEKYEAIPNTGKSGEHAVGQFIYRWRRVFLDQLQPRHLPNGWLAEDGILR